MPVAYLQRRPQRLRREETRFADDYSSNLRTAMNASVGSCTVPSVRIFFLPAPPKGAAFWGSPAI